MNTEVFSTFSPITNNATVNIDVPYCLSVCVGVCLASFLKVEFYSICMLMLINTAILLSRMAQPILNVWKCIHTLSHDGYYQSIFGQFNLMEIKCLFTEFYFPCCWLFMVILICLLAFVVRSWIINSYSLPSFLLVIFHFLMDVWKLFMHSEYLIFSYFICDNYFCPIPV